MYVCCVSHDEGQSTQVPLFFSHFQPRNQIAPTWLKDTTQLGSSSSSSSLFVCTQPHYYTFKTMMKKYKKKRTSYTPPIFRASFLPHSAERGNPAIWATDENKGGKEKKKENTCQTVARTHVTMYRPKRAATLILYSRPFYFFFAFHLFLSCRRYRERRPFRPLFLRFLYI